MTRQTPGNVLDKIQAELAETKRREEELRRARRDLVRSQPDLTKLQEMNEQESGENYSESDVEVRIHFLQASENCNSDIRRTLRPCCTPEESQLSSLSGRAGSSVRRRRSCWE